MGIEEVGRIFKVTPDDDGGGWGGAILGVLFLFGLAKACSGGGDQAAAQQYSATKAAQIEVVSVEGMVAGGMEP